MKTKNILKIGMFILLLTLGALVFLFFVQPKINIVRAEFNKDHNNLYPPNCYVFFQNKKYLIREVYKYENGILNEYWFLGSEGFAVEKLGINGNSYSKEQKEYEFLNLEKAKDYVVFNSEKYKIDYINEDTIISKIDLNNIIVFINKNNLLAY
ncbi:hypothetical protein IR010_09120 [Flavobacterium sp. MR2016-29]|uniref:hypothetical protein n=1 Tax=Flavobacterium sp. MR2016-29 TaxID=2783795 RepID=UPI001889D81A|nr:hypothetical protein [Flavobacterium sp. MR2016-29]MBF4492700.1 hypothetical protein [Flavobacterium sp. MR2016-29]